MSTATVQQIEQDITPWLELVQHGETVAITEQDRVVAQLTPPEDTTANNSGGHRSMAEWLAEQDGRMLRILGGRIVADSAAILDDQRAGRQ